MEGRAVTITHPKFADMPRTYVKLVEMYPPRPLHDDDDARDVEELVAEMAGHELTKDQEDYLDLLSDLLLKYHGKRHPPARQRRTPADSLKFLLEESGTTAAQLSRILRCSQPLVSLLLNGKREPSKANVKKLAKHFKLDAGYFL
jgi:HTH-type transcriptional regulator/antitoxin HigA